MSKLSKREDTEMKLKKLAIAGITATTLLLNPLSPFLGDNQVAEAAVGTPYPVSVPVEYEWKNVEEYGLSLEKGAFKINVGKRVGTLVLKLYFTNQYPSGAANTQYWDTVNGRDSGYALFDKNQNLDSTAKAVSLFDRYRYYPNLTVEKYLSGFQDGGVNASTNQRFIGLGVHINKVLDNDGVYYLDLPNGMIKGNWEVKAYFYENLNLEERVFNEVDRYFPLLGKVWWDGVELKPGQIGRLTVIKDTPLYKLDGVKETYSRTLKAGENYRIYAFKPGKLSVGGGYYIDRDERVKYETPSKSKLSIVQMRSE